MMKLTQHFSFEKTKQTKTAIHDNKKIKYYILWIQIGFFKENISGDFYKTLSQVFGNVYLLALDTTK